CCCGCLLCAHVPPGPPFFPYTTLFRSRRHRRYRGRKSRPRSGSRRSGQDARRFQNRRRTEAEDGATILHRPSGEARPREERPCRSEEHTSELQSRENLVCRLLLEKKK